MVAKAFSWINSIIIFYENAIRSTSITFLLVFKMVQERLNNSKTKYQKKQNKKIKYQKNSKLNFLKKTYL